MNKTWKAAFAKAEASVPPIYRLAWAEARLALLQHRGPSSPHGLPEVGIGAEGEKHGRQLATVAMERLVDEIRIDTVAPADLIGFISWFAGVGGSIGDAAARLSSERRSPEHVALFIERSKAAYKAAILEFLETVMSGWKRDGMKAHLVDGGIALLPVALGVWLFPEDAPKVHPQTFDEVRDHLASLSSLALEYRQAQAA